MARLCYLICFLSSLVAGNAINGAQYGIWDLFKHLRNLEIIILFPKDYPVTQEELRSSLEKPVGRLMENDIPTQIYTRRGWGRGPPLRPARYIDHRIAWVVLVTVSHRLPWLALTYVLSCCQDWPDRVISSVMSRDLLHVIRVHNSVIPSSHTFLDPYVMRCWTPYYLVMLDWLQPLDHILTESARLHNVCYDVNHCRLIAMPQYFLTFKGGMDAHLTHVSGLERSFQGYRVTIRPETNYYRRWEFWQLFLAIKMRRINDIEQREYWLGTVYMSLARANNFTFDTVDDDNSESMRPYEYCRRGTIATRTALVCFYAEYEPECTYERKGLNEFMYFSTLTTSELSSHQPYKLSSLTTPVTIIAAGTLFSFTLSIGILFIVEAKNRDVSGALLLASSSFWVQATSANRPLRTLVHVYVTWLLLCTLISIIYSNLLQSALIVPITQPRKSSFDEMVHQNFSFSSTMDVAVRGLAGLINGQFYPVARNGTELARAAEIIEKERILGGQVQWAEFSEISQNMGQQLLGISESQKMALVEESRLRNKYASLMKILGFNVIIGEERFFNLPYFWDFQVEKSHLLLSSLERLKSAGIEDYLMGQDHSMSDKLSRDIIMGENMWSKEKAGEDSGSVGLNDSIVLEAFVLLGYSVTICVVSLQLELFLTLAVKATLRAILCFKTELVRGWRLIRCGKRPLFQRVFHLKGLGK